MRRIACRLAGLGARPAAVLGLAAFLAVLFLGPGAAHAVDRWTDIPDDRWQDDYGITAADAATIAEGYTDGTFRPYQDVTRGQFAKMAVSGLGVQAVDPATPTFTDVGRSHIFYPYIEGAAAAGLINGFTDDAFRPGSTINRQQMNSILARHISKEEIEARGSVRGVVRNYPSLQAWYEAEGDFYLGGFDDGNQVADVHRAGTAYLVYHEVVHGSDDFELDPTASLNRAQAVTVVLRAIEVVGEVTDVTPPPPPSEVSTIPETPAVYSRPYVVGKTIAGGRVAVYDTFEGGTSEVAQGTADDDGDFSVRVSSLAEGEHSFTVKVRNDAGRVSEASEAVPYVYDATPPSGEIVRPEDGEALRTRTPTFQVDAADEGSGIGAVTFQYQPVSDGAGYVTISTDGSSPYRAFWGDISLPDGSYDFVATVRDGAGNELRLDSIRVTVDLEAPTVELTSPAADDAAADGVFYTEDRTPSFAADAADEPAEAGKEASGVERVDFFYALEGDLPGDPADWEAGDFTLVSSDDSPGYSASWGDVELTDGRYVLAVQSVDEAGNASALDYREVVVDTEPPVVEFTAPTTDEVLPDNTDYTITWTLEDLTPPETVKLEYSPTGGAPWTLIDDAASNEDSGGSGGSYVWSVPGQSEDVSTFALRLTAMDEAGPEVGDEAGHTTVVVSDSFAVRQAPAPATDLAADDPDTENEGIDGRDFRLSWTPSPSDDAASQDIYILPKGTELDTSTHAAAAAGLAPETTEWTGTDALTTDGTGAAFDPETEYALYVVTVDGDGAETASEGAAWSSEEPEPVTGLTATDPDGTEDGVDGRDFSAEWTPSTSDDVILQEIYILPQDTTFLPAAAGGTHAPVADFADNATASWTGDDSLTSDSAGDSLAEGSYDLHLVAWSDNGLWAAAKAVVSAEAP